MLPYLVLDQNQLRKGDLIAAAASRCQGENLKLIIPDGAGFEMSKSSEVLDTWRNSLKFLALNKDEVVVSSKMTDLMKLELETGFACSDVVEHGATILFRNLLSALALSDDSSLTRLVNGPIREQLPASQKIWSDFESHRQIIIRMRDMLRDELSNAEVKALRRDPTSELGTWISSINGMRFVYQVIKSRAGDELSSLRLASTPSVNGAFVTSLALVALHWLAFGGLEDAKPEKITNDFHDIEYAVLGSLSVELLSSDKRLQRIKHCVSHSQVCRQTWVRGQLGSAEFKKLLSPTPEST